MVCRNACSRPQLELGLKQNRPSDKPGLVRFSGSVEMPEHLHDGRWQFGIIMSLLPFVCFLTIMTASQDQPADSSPREWEYAVLSYSVAISLLLPLVAIGIGNHSWLARRRNSTLFVAAWLVMQFVALFVLALVSVALYGDGP